MNSALAQVPSPLEVIVIDDGSIDQTAEVVRDCGDRILYVEQPNRGPASARNAGLRLAHGNFVAFLDADDFWLPGFLASCINFLEKHLEAVAVSTGMRFQRWNSGVVDEPEALLARQSKEPFVIEDFFAFWAEHNHIRTGSCVIRKEALDAVGGQVEDLRISEDLELWAMLGTKGYWGFIPEVRCIFDSERVSAASGWLEKYNLRRSLCPIIEQWQRRIVPELRTRDWAGFKVIRGRLAANFAHTHVIAGRAETARQMVLDYGREMPPVWSAYLMRLGLRFGPTAWALACALIRAREQQKALFMRIGKRQKA